MITALVVVVGVALFGSLQKAATYAASCKVRIAAVGPGGASQVGDDPKKNPTEIYASFEEMQQIIQSPVMAAKVSKDMGVAFDRVSGKINAFHAANTGIFDLTVVGGDPKFAARTCDAYMVRFLKERVDGATAKVQASKDLIDAQIADIEAQRKSYDLKIVEAAHLNEKSLVDELKFEQLGLYYRKAQKVQDEVDLDTALHVKLGGGGEVVSNAGIGIKVGPDHMRDGILGLIVGLIFGAGLGLVREYMDDTVRDKEGAQRDLGLPVLASLPSGRGDDPFGEDAAGSIEAARMLRTNLASQGLGADIRCMVVTSTLAKRRPTALVSLAGAIAEAGRTVLVIGADFRNPRIHESFGVGNAVGLTNVIRGQVTFDKAIRPVPGQVGVYVMPTGPVMGNPGELLSTEEMAMVIRRARKWADIVLIDAPPVLAAADASVLGTYSDGVLLVMSSGQTLRSQATEAKEQLKAAGARLLGVVMFGASDSQNGKSLAIPASRDDDMMPPLSPYGGGFDDVGYGFGGGDTYASPFDAEPQYDLSGYDAGYEDDYDIYDEEPVVARARTTDGRGKNGGSSKKSAPKKKAKTLAASAPARVRREDATMTKAPKRAVGRKAGVVSRAPSRVRINERINEPASGRRTAKPSAQKTRKPAPKGRAAAPKGRAPAKGRATSSRATPSRAPSSRATSKGSGRSAGYERTFRSRSSDRDLF
ncbi:MAG: hypothetical protein NVSMB57_08700 [Actinomycetota bacterium]